MIVYRYTGARRTTVVIPLLPRRCATAGEEYGRIYHRIILGLPATSKLSDLCRRTLRANGAV